MSDEPTPISPDPTAPAVRRQRGFWRRDVLIWAGVLLLLAVLATWRLTTTGRGPEDADSLYPAAIAPNNPPAAPARAPASTTP